MPAGAFRQAFILTSKFVSGAEFAVGMALNALVPVASAGSLQLPRRACWPSHVKGRLLSRNVSGFGLSSICGESVVRRLTSEVKTVRNGSRTSIRAISSNEFRNGTSIEIDGAPWRILEFLHVKPGKGAAFVRTKLKNYITGNTVDRTFRAGENVIEAVVSKEQKQFTYKEGEQYVFMDLETYEELRVTQKEVGDKSKFLMEGLECSVLSWQGRVIDLELPATVKLKVTQSEPGVKGDTAQGGSKTVTLETGATAIVPLFVTEEDTIIVQTRDGSYVGRA